jgi:CRISPR/Cas system-associated exonuclease Cas4 (RecB family)
MAVVQGASAASLKAALIAEIRHQAAANPWQRQLVLVSSGPLRRQLAAELAAKGALSGVEVLALWSFAQRFTRESPEYAETPLHRLQVLHQDPLLEDGAPDSGFAAALGDLLSAGVNESRLAELASATSDLTAEAWPRRTAFIDACSQVLKSVGLRGRDRTLAAAAAAVRNETSASPAKVHLVGFASATGLVSDLIRALMERGATLWLEVPEGDAAKLPLNAARRHVDCFVAAVAPASPEVREVPVMAHSAPTWSCFTAPDTQAEADEIALRVHALLNTGTAPQDIGVVLTDFGSASGAVLRAFDALGIPFLAASHKPLTPLRRAARMLARTLRHGASEHPVADALPLPAEVLTLGVETEPVTLSHCAHWVRRMGGEVQRQAASTSVELSVAGFGELATKLSALADSVQNAPATTSVRAAACRRWLALELEQVSETPPQNTPSGVQVLNTAQARGLTFQHAFLVGAGRGTWPRTRNHGAVFPAAARAAVKRVLPALAADDGQDELAHNFIQLMSCAPQVTVSWARGGQGHGGSAPWVLGTLAQSERTLEAVGLRANHEARLEAALQAHGALSLDAAVVLAGLRRDSEQHVQLIAKHRGEPKLAEERALLLEAFEREGIFAGSTAPSPWHGCGVSTKSRPRSGTDDAAHVADSPPGTISPTRLESLAACGWKLFLERCLYLKGMKEPLEAQWKVGPLERGKLVHKAIEILVEGARAPRDSTQEGTQREVTPASLEKYATTELIAAAVEEAMKFTKGRSGSDAPGPWREVPVLREVEVKRVTAAVNQAIKLLTGNAVEAVCKTEADYTTPLAGLNIHFRADIEARSGDGRIFVDWKTSKNPADLGSRKPHLDDGTKLQAAIYASYEDADGTATAQGVYAYVDQEFKEDDKRWQIVTKQESADVLSGVLKTLGELMEEEQAPPRVAAGRDSDNEPVACQFCDFTRACVLGDSRQRRLLTERGMQDDAFGEWWRLTHRGEDGASHA